MTTLGQVQIRLSKLPQSAGVDKTVLLGVVNDVYQRFLGSYQWSRLVKSGVIETTAVYQTGFVAIADSEEGPSTVLTGVDTVWTAAMTGRRIRIAGQNETYVFTYVSPESATIDRAYEGNTQTTGTYVIFQSIYAVPVDVDFIDSIEVPSTNQDLDQVTAEYLDKLATDRWALGHPSLYAPAPDVTVSNIVYAAVEFYPVPSIAEGLIIHYHETVDPMTSTSNTFLPWVPIECIVAGCEAELYAIKGDLNGYQMKEAKFQVLLRDAMSSDSDRQGPTAMIMDERFTWHRTARALNHDTTRSTDTGYN